MNKTIIININGIVFHIEEDAYDILKNYMTEVKRHFAASPDSLEITTDIENRVAEMFSELLEKENKQVIAEQDVNAVVEQMGSVADFESAASEDEKQSNSYQHHINNTERRLFRDTDDHLVGGVCSGIANYFDLNPVWVRLAFALLCAAGGSGLIIYAILWIVVPKAITRADRMAMKGEKQNLQGFKRNFEEETSTLRQNLTNFGQEARPFVYKIRDFIAAFFNHLGTFIGSTGKLLVKLIGILLLLVCFAVAVSLVVALIVVVVIGKNPHISFPFSVFQYEFANTVYTAAFLIAFIPVLGIIMLILKGIFNTGSIGRPTASVFLVIWLCSLGLLVYYGAKVAYSFRETASFTENIDIKPSSNNTYYLNLNDIKYFTHDDSLRLDIKDHFRNVTVNDDDANNYNGEPRGVNINIERSDINKPVLEESFRASGHSFENALLNARNVSYNFSQQDSVLKFDHTLYKKLNAPWHGEEVTLTLKLPLNAQVVIDERLDNYLQDGGMIYNCKNADKRQNARSAIFIMTDNGLQCKIDTLITPKADTSAVKQIIKDSTGEVKDTTVNKF